MEVNFVQQTKEQLEAMTRVFTKRFARSSIIVMCVSHLEDLSLNRRKKEIMYYRN